MTVEVPVTEVQEVQVLRLGPNDALVFRHPGRLPNEAHATIWRNLTHWAKETFGREVKCIVLEEGASIEVLRDGQ